MTRSPAPVAWLNGRPHAIRAGESILAFAQRALGPKAIPTLCEGPNLEAYGACRVCSVEVARSAGETPRTLAACHTPVAEGMRIDTDGPELLRLRRNVVELVLTDHPLDCLTCSANGRCELQDVAARVGIRDVRYPAGEHHQDREPDRAHPYLTSDLAKCIQCNRCVRACDEVQGNFSLGVSGRGFDARIVVDADAGFDGSSCVSCGACVQACPTSAISDRHQEATPLGAETTRTICTYCGVGCNLEVATAGGRVVSVSAPWDATVNEGHLCVKGRYAFGFYDHPERLRTPLVRRDGELVPVSWDEAYDFLAGELTRIRRDHGADAVAGISSARCTNEENYLMQKFLRAVLGTNNIDGCARVCHAPTAMGMQRAFGTGAATNSIADLDHTDCVLLIGANPTDGHPVTGSRIKRYAMRGGTLIVVDPRRTDLARLAQHHLQLRPGTNLALLNLLARCLIEEGLVDEAFVRARTEGYAAFAAATLALDPEALSGECGVPVEAVRAAARAYGGARAAMSFHGLGVTEQHQGTFTVEQIANLAMITGNIGRPGCGVNPLRGQNNVQGAADMGVQPHQGAGYLDVHDPVIRERFRSIYGTEMPDHHGLKIPEMFDAALAGRLKALWVIGEDVAQTDPNVDHVHAALDALELLVVQDLFLNETAKRATVVLPASSFLEKDGSFTNGERRVQAVRRVLDPLPGTKPDGVIQTEMMQRLGYPQPDFDAAEVLDEIAAVVPWFHGVRREDLGTNGIQWPAGEDGKGTAILHVDAFKRGPGRIAYRPYEASPERALIGTDYPFTLTTNRLLEHYNCGTMTRRTANARLVGEDRLWIHPEDAAAHGIGEGDAVRLRSPRGAVTLNAWLTDRVPPGVLSTTFHFPAVPINALTGEGADTETLCPEFKVVAAAIERV